MIFNQQRIPQCKKKSNKQSSQKEEVKEKKQKPLPEWNFSTGDENKYKLSASELVQKKVSLVSKHKFEAKEEWEKRQEKLKSGILDDETMEIYKTAKESKKLPTSQPERIRKNLSQMIDFNKNLGQSISNSTVFGLEDGFQTQESQILRESKSSYQSINNTVRNKSKGHDHKKEEEENFMGEIQNQLKSTRNFLQKVESCSCSSKDPKHLMKLHNKIPNGASQQNKKNNKENEDSSNKSKFKKNMSGQKEQIEVQSEQNNSVFPEEQKLLKEEKELQVYFKSLNKIEDTIKFMEENILGQKKEMEKYGKNFESANYSEKKTHNLDEKSKYSDQKETQNFDNEFIQKETKNFENEYIQKEEQILIPKVNLIQEDMFFFQDKNKNSSGTKQVQNLNEINFFSTKPSYQNQNTINQNVFQENKDEFHHIQKQNFPMENQASQKSQNYPQNQTYNPQQQNQQSQEEEDDDLDLKNIREMLEATKKDIQNMNQKESGLFSGNNQQKTSLFELFDTEGFHILQKTNQNKVKEPEVIKPVFQNTEVQIPVQMNKKNKNQIMYDDPYAAQIQFDEIQNLNDEEEIVPRNFHIVRHFDQQDYPPQKPINSIQKKFVQNSPLYDRNHK